LVKSLTELLDGDLELKSRPGEGTTVSVQLPRGRILDGETAEITRHDLIAR
jgi:signal transduction histidine kinase